MASAKLKPQRLASSEPKSVPFPTALLAHIDREEKADPQGEETVLRRSLVVDPPIPLPTLSLMKGMFAGFASKSFHIRLTRVATLTSSGAGAMALVTTVPPSQFDQYSALSLLFQECRIRSTRISLASNLNFDQTTPPAGGAMAVAFNPSAVVGTTVTISTVMRLPKSKLYSLTQGNWPVTLQFRYPKGMPWSNVTGGSGGVDPLGGIRGAWCNVAMTTLSNSIVYLTYCIEADYEFRSLM